MLRQKHVSRAGIRNYISRYLWDVITYSWPWYLLLSYYPISRSHHPNLCSDLMKSRSHHPDLCSKYPCPQCACPLQWRHNERDGFSNHQPHHCLLNRLYRCRSKKTSKLRVTGLFAGNSPVTGEFTAQRASNADDVSIWWRDHANVKTFDVANIQLREFEIFR